MADLDDKQILANEMARAIEVYGPEYLQERTIREFVGGKTICPACDQIIETPDNHLSNCYLLSLYQRGKNLGVIK